jgi:hypothetical protein
MSEEHPGDVSAEAVELLHKAYGQLKNRFAK